ncbi:MAG: hypothetical protein LBH39_03575 [Clostridiales Family XIII bacterium]|jgi:hypothetical protein|nr:hypothetical protein [Clostridiales Family XIII bacterium]
MTIFNRLLFGLLILIIPLVALATAANAVFRLPDIYRYEFNRSGVLGEINLEISSDELSEFFSGYMFGSFEEFQITGFYMGRMRPIFSIGEGIAMEQMRTLLNESLLALCGLFVLMLFIYWFLLRQDRKEAVRIAYRAGMALYVIIAAGTSAVLLIEDLRQRALDSFFAYSFDESDMLPQLLPSQFMIEGQLVIIVISLIILAVGHSVTKRLTRPDRMFY